MKAPDGEDSFVDSVYVMYDARLLTTGIPLCEHVPWSKLDDQMYWLSEYHAAKRTDYNETLSTELTNNRSTDYHEVCTEHKVVSAEYNEIAADEKATEY